MPRCHRCFVLHSRCSLAKTSQPGPCATCKRAGEDCEPHESDPLLRRSRRQLVSPHLGRPRVREITSASLDDLISIKPTPEPQQLVECHISIDGGADYLKASYQLYFLGETGPSAGPLQTVVWFNTDSSVRSQIAFTNEGRLVWGLSVDEGLAANEIDESQVLRRLKPALLDPSMRLKQDVWSDMTRLLDAGRLKEVTASLRYYGEDPDCHSVAAVTLLSEFYGIAYRTTLGFIAESHAGLGWPAHLDPGFYKTWSPPGTFKISVSLPLPVELSPSHVSCVMAAAQAAKLPNPYPVDESACALIHHLHRSTGQSILGKTYFIIDGGAASIDSQLFTVVEVGPLRVQEIALPQDARKTAWRGGSYTNDAAVELIMECIDVHRVLTALRVSGSSITTQEKLMQAIAEQFELKKRRFSGHQQVILIIPGLPDIPESRLCGGDKVVLQPEDVVKVFAGCLKTMMTMTDRSIDSTSSVRAPRKNQVHQIDEIITSGGCFRSAYLRNQYRNRYSSNLGRRTPHFYPIPVTFPPETAQDSVTVAQGGVLLGAEKGLIKSRQLRRSFCVGRWEIVDPALYPRHCIEPSEQDGKKRLRLTRFLIKQGSYPQRIHFKPLQGWRGLMPSAMSEDGTWLVEEEIWWSDTLTQNGIWIDSPGIDLDLHPMPRPLGFRLTSEDLLSEE